MQRMAWGITMLGAATIAALSGPAQAATTAPLKIPTIRQGSGLGSDGEGHPHLVPSPNKNRLLDINKDGKVNLRDVFRVFGVKTSMDAVSFLIGYNSAQDGFGFHRSNFSPAGRISLRRNGIMFRKGWRF
jgi:hypothetical protein